MNELIEYIARSIVDEPTKVQVKVGRRGHATNMQLKVAKQDMGRVIGRNGRVANAMRLLLRVSAAQHDERANLEIIDPE